VKKKRKSNTLWVEKNYKVKFLISSILKKVKLTKIILRRKKRESTVGKKMKVIYCEWKKNAKNKSERKTGKKTNILWEKNTKDKKTKVQKTNT